MDTNVSDVQIEDIYKKLNNNTRNLTESGNSIVQGEPIPM